MNDIDSLIQEILNGIETGGSPDLFLPYIKQLSQKTQFIASSIHNEYMYRVRREDGTLFNHTDKLKYPPPQKSKKGRLNQEGESIAYMSLGEITPLVELDISYYEVHCLIKIQYVKKTLLFHYAGVKGEYESNNPNLVKVNEFYRDILRNKDNKYYNFTIALCKHFLANIKSPDGSDFPSGLIYTSAYDDKSNRNLHNVAVKPNVFDEHFKVIEATYQVMIYDNNTDSINIKNLNKGSIDNEGNVSWNLNYEEMMNDFLQKYSKHIFVINNNKDIINYKYGGGGIIGSDHDSYTVRFPNGNQKVMKKEINNS